MTVFRNAGLWDTSNVAFRDGQVVRYNKRQPDPEMAFIDYGANLFRAEASRPATGQDRDRDVSEGHEGSPIKPGSSRRQCGLAACSGCSKLCRHDAADVILACGPQHSPERSFCLARRFGRPDWAARRGYPWAPCRLLVRRSRRWPSARRSICRAGWRWP
jgi:hypothetical protein